MAGLLRLLGLLIVALTACQAGSGPSAVGTTPMTSTAASYARAQHGSPAPPSTAGSISGTLTYPSEFLPAQTVYAVSVDGRLFYRVETVVGQGHYKMFGVPAGDYFVLAVLRMPLRAGSGEVASTRFGAAYTKASICGLFADCPDHTLMPVRVESRQETVNIKPDDWYAPQDFYPLVPGGGPAVLRLDAAPAAYPTSQAAAIDVAQARTGGRYVERQQDCPGNLACTWFTSSHFGQGAAYYTGFAGSNLDIQACAFYVLGAGTAWQAFSNQCRFEADPFPAVGSAGHVTLGMGETGCVNVRAAPGTTARILACLADRTSVRIDDGPVFLAPSSNTAPSSADLWWHLAGRGWMVDRYLHG